MLLYNVLKKEANSLKLIRFYTFSISVFMVFMGKSPRMLMEMLHQMFFVCFFNRRPFLWCWMLWITITHQNQVNLRPRNHRSENENLFQIIVPDNQCWIRTKQLFVKSSQVPLSGRGCWNQMVWSKNIHENVDLLGISSTPISRIYRSSSGKRENIHWVFHLWAEQRTGKKVYNFSARCRR